MAAEAEMEDYCDDDEDAEEGDLGEEADDDELFADVEEG